MNFFEQQRLNKRNSRVLVILFMLAVLITAFSTAAVIYKILAHQTGSEASYRTIVQPNMLDNQLFWIYAGCIGLGLCIVSLIKTISLSNKGSTIAMALGGTRIYPNTKKPLQKRLINVVEEMSLASGVVVPEVYVLEKEDSINAFAAGSDINHAAIGVNQGTLEKLDRDELQAVIAHEFSHILNGDSNLNIKLIGYLFGISCIFDLGLRISRSSGRSSRNNSGGALGIGLIAVGGMGMLMASWIKSIISREREYLADASAVQFTRNPGAVTAIFKKLEADYQWKHMAARTAGEFNHMFFREGIKKSIFSFATHPPLISRIQAIQPNYSEAMLDQELNSVLKDIESTQAHNLALTVKPEPKKKDAQKFTNLQKFGILAVGAGATIRHAGQLKKESIDQSQRFIEKNGEDLDRIHSAEFAKGLIVAMIFKTNIRKQLSALNLKTNEADHKAIEEMIEQSDQLLEHAFLIRSLEHCKGLSSNDKAEFVQQVFQLIQKDGVIEHHEQVLFLYVREALNPGFMTPRLHLNHVSQYTAASHILYALNFDSSNDFETAFAQASKKHFKGLLVKPNSISLANLIKMIEVAKRKPIPFKEKIVNAVLDVVLHDKQISAKEFETASLICTCLQVPIPLEIETSQD